MIGVLLVVVLGSTGCTVRASGGTQDMPSRGGPPSAAPPPRGTSAPTAAASSGTATGTAPAGAAADLLARLPVKGRAALTGYERRLFGQTWADVDRNGCDTRNDVLRRDLTVHQLRPGTGGCVVLAGTLADPYSGQPVSFRRGGVDDVEIDHVVALADAWVTGALAWSPQRRVAFANDPVNLLAVSAAANRSKGESDAATWLPPNRAFRCRYAARQVTVKSKYGLWVTAAEGAALATVLRSCPGQPAEPFGTQPTESAVGAAPAGPSSSSTAVPPVSPVSPGALCAPAGALGRTRAGTLMRCTTTASDPRNRWRRA